MDANADSPMSSAPSTPAHGIGNPDNVCHGTPVMGGIAYAPVLWARRNKPVSETYEEIDENNRPHELTRFQAAAVVVADRLLLRSKTTVGSSSDLLVVAASFAQDPTWRARACKLIEAGVPAPQAATKTTAEFVRVFQSKGGILAERVTDIEDVCQRIVAQLRGEPEPGIPQVTTPVVLCADDLGPADTAGLDPTKVVALVTRMGGPTSHTAIIARQLGIPCVVAALTADRLEDGEPVLVNAYNGVIYRNYQTAEANTWARRDYEHRALIEQWHGPARLADGTHVQLLANVQNLDDINAALTYGADGVGLLRTELAFLNSAQEPSREEQTRTYRQMLQALQGKVATVRTLDAGSDKPLTWASLAHEMNPALGVRGLRATGREQGIIMRQLDALAEASANFDGTLKVMAPMVSTVDEAAWFASLVRERNMSPGIMVEVPATAILIDHFLPLVDFLSVGTNDLTQYVMAADRTSPLLAKLTDTWQPAVLTLIENVARSAQKVNVPVGVCGEAAADPLMACILLGFGVTSLSAAPTTLARVGTQLAAVTFEQCQEAARAVLDADDPVEARRSARHILQG